jgi:glycosyltransferase involved in cell wall biosynthesis
MKISLLHYSAPPVVGGVESVLAAHARLMAAAGHAVTVLAGRGAAFAAGIPLRLLPLLDSRHARVLAVKHELDAGRCPPDFSLLKDEILAALHAELQGCDLLLVHNAASLHKNLALTAALHELSRAGRPRLVLWHHDLAWTTPRYRHELHPGHPWDLLRQPWEGVHQVVISEVRRRELAGLFDLPAESIRVIPNGVDLDAFYKLEPQTVSLVDHLELSAADPLFLLPVRLTPRKNIELALQVLAEVRRRMPDAMLLVTGPEGAHNPANAAYRGKLLALREELKLASAAHFLAEATDEYLPDAVIADFYRLADALLFTSREEGFGLPLLEAGFSGLPVFCADIPVLRELGGEEVSYFDLGQEPQAIAAQIIARLGSEQTARWRRRARNAYTWRSIYRAKIDPLIQECVQ